MGKTSKEQRPYLDSLQERVNAGAATADDSVEYIWGIRVLSRVYDGAHQVIVNIELGHIDLQGRKDLHNNADVKITQLRCRGQA